MDANEIFERLAELKNRIETNNEAPLDGVEQAIMYDVAISLGLSKAQAESLAGDAATEQPAARELDPDGETMITLVYTDGEYLSGHEVFGPAAKLMEKIGLAHYVSGWGYHVENSVVEKLGKVFQYQAAVDLAAPELERKQQAELYAQAELQSRFHLAAESGKPVEIDSYMAECDEPDCSQDYVVIYAMPDGTTKTMRNHTY